MTSVETKSTRVETEDADAKIRFSSVAVDLVCAVVCVTVATEVYVTVGCECPRETGRERSGASRGRSLERVCAEPAQVVARRALGGTHPHGGREIVALFA